ncbi:hypothetical protein BX600DRAFT_472436 [Xylariales sp. PMI_506]|nr:hypothetical protein BX600DRAFT_472436 [Xylariales sp. PMI_506]
MYCQSRGLLNGSKWWLFSLFIFFPNHGIAKKYQMHGLSAGRHGCWFVLAISLSKILTSYIGTGHNTLRDSSSSCTRPLAVVSVALDASYLGSPREEVQSDASFSSNLDFDDTMMQR